MEITYNEEFGVWVSKEGIAFKEINSSERGGNIVIKYKCIKTKKGRIDLHRLVAKTFIPNPENKPCVCHVNDNPSDNRAENLWWGTHKENMQDMLKKGRNRTFGQVNAKQKAMIEEILERLVAGKSQREIAEEMGLHESRISQVIKLMKDKGYLKQKNQEDKK